MAAAPVHTTPLNPRPWIPLPLVPVPSSSSNACCNRDPLSIAVKSISVKFFFCAFGAREFRPKKCSAPTIGEGGRGPDPPAETEELVTRGRTHPPTPPPPPGRGAVTGRSSFANNVSVPVYRTTPSQGHYPRSSRNVHTGIPSPAPSTTAYTPDHAGMRHTALSCHPATSSYGPYAPEKTLIGLAVAHRNPVACPLGDHIQTGMRHTADTETGGGVYCGRGGGLRGLEGGGGDVLERRVGGAIKLTSNAGWYVRVYACVRLLRRESSSYCCGND